MALRLDQDSVGVLQLLLSYGSVCAVPFSIHCYSFDPDVLFRCYYSVIYYV